MATAAYWRSVQQHLLKVSFAKKMSSRGLCKPREMKDLEQRKDIGDAHSEAGKARGPTRPKYTPLSGNTMLRLWGRLLIAFR
jgi:hypothetical protein